MLKVEPRKRNIMGKCLNKHCNNKSGSGYCSSCRSRLSRIADPVRYAFNNLKNRAKQRGKEFNLSLTQFRRFCIKTKYIAGKGRSADSFTIDRIKEEKGYTMGNIQVLEHNQNIKKRFLTYDWQHKIACVW